MQRIHLLIFIVCVSLAISCGSSTDNQPARDSQTNAPSAGTAAVATAGTPAGTGGMSDAQACYEVKVPKDRKVLKSQTFAIDFEPFKKSCFVTTHDAEFTDPPLNSEIAIFKDGKEIPGLRSGAPDEAGSDRDGTGLSTAGCWVEAVAFQDVNGDHLTDAIVVAKCGTKGGAYNENLVYINNGKVLFTRPNVNVRLNDFNTVKEILLFINENPRDFSLTDAANSHSQP